MTLAFRILYRFYRVNALLKGWIHRRFTHAGLGIIAATLIAGVMGVDTEHNLEYQAFAFLFFLVLLATLFALSFRGKFNAERVLPRFGTVGVPLVYTVTLRNLTSKTQSGLTLLERLVETFPTFPEWHAAQQVQQKGMRSFRVEQAHRSRQFRAATVAETPAPPLGPGEQAEVPMTLTPARRGPLRFKQLLVARVDPFNLFRAFARVPLPQSVLILPHRYPLPPVPLPGSMKYQEGGVAMASQVGQSDEFVSLRDYRAGDPLRHIHWRTWARTGKPVVKEFEDEFYVRHALVLDTFTDASGSELFEEAVSVAASFACTIQTQESLLDLLFVGNQSYCFTAGRGLSHTDQILEILASVSVSDRPFEQLESLVLQHASQVSGCICVLLAWDEVRQEFVRRLRLLGVPVLVLVITQPGSPELARGVMSDEPQNFHALEAGQMEQGLAKLGGPV